VRGGWRIFWGVVVGIVVAFEVFIAGFALLTMRAKLPVLLLIGTPSIILIVCMLGQRFILRRREQKKISLLRLGIYWSVLFILAGFIIPPSFLHDREVTHPIGCAVHLCEIWHALDMYASDNNGAFPDRLSLLVKYGYVPPEYLICPDDPRKDVKLKKLAAFRKGEEYIIGEELLNFLDEETSYVYEGKGLRKGEVAPDKIILYDKPYNHPDGLNVVYAGGGVKWVGYKKKLRYGR